MNPATTVIGFAPLVLFAVLDGRTSVSVAAIVGAAAALAVIVATARRGLSALPIVQAGTLAAVAVIALAGDDDVRDFLTRYGRGIVSLAIAGFILATAHFAPFTATFARASVPRERWHSAPFIELNRRISTVWGLAVLVLGVTHLLSGAAGSSLSRQQSFLLDWVPTIVAVILALRYTRQSVAAARS